MGKREKLQYYSLKNILSKNCLYNLVFGERSNGKTFAAQKYILEQYVQTGKQGAILRRWREDFVGKRGTTMWDGVVAAGVVNDLTGGEWTGIYYQGSRWYLARTDEDGERIVDDRPFAYGFSIASMEHDKSTSYPNVTTIFFDEFITRQNYLTDEFTLFMNVCSTIIRDRDDVKIIMCGNAVNKYCIYFTEMGLKHVGGMNPGDIDVYDYGESGLSVAVEFSDSISKKGKPSDKYFAFDNPKLAMITGQNGIWELALYPHCPKKYRKEHIKFTYFISFNGELMQCEIIHVDGTLFTFVHRKTTDLQNPDRDLIFSTDFDPRPNWRRKLFPAKTKLEKTLATFYLQEKVFYQDNDCGETIRNYMNWCKG